jgi:hypothetical protein
MKEVKGKTFLEPGFVFASCIPIQTMCILDHSIRKKIKTAGLKVVQKNVIEEEEKFCGVVKVSG